LLRVNSKGLIVSIILLLAAIATAITISLRTTAAFDAQATISTITPTQIDSRTDYSSPKTINISGTLSFEKALFDDIAWTGTPPLPLYGIRLLGVGPDNSVTCAAGQILQSGTPIIPDPSFQCTSGDLVLGALTLTPNPTTNPNDPIEANYSLNLTISAAFMQANFPDRAGSVIVEVIFGVSEQLTEVSAIAEISILGNIAIIDQSGNQTAYVGDSAVFWVELNSEQGVTYRWFKNGTIIPGQAGSGDSAWVINNVAAGDAGTYSVRISQPGAADIFSSNMVLTVTTLSITLPPQRAPQTIYVENFDYGISVGQSIHNFSNQGVSFNVGNIGGTQYNYPNLRFYWASNCNGIINDGVPRGNFGFSASPGCSDFQNYDEVRGRAYPVNTYAASKICLQIYQDQQYTYGGTTRRYCPATTGHNGSTNNFALNYETAMNIFAPDPYFGKCPNNTNAGCEWDRGPSWPALANYPLFTASGVNVPRLDRFYSFSAIIASPSCGMVNAGTPHASPRLKFSVIDGGVEKFLSNQPLEFCLGNSIVNTQWKESGAVLAGQIGATLPGNAFVPHTDAMYFGGRYWNDYAFIPNNSTIGYRMYNTRTTSWSNDFAIDAVTMVDSTPTMVKQFSDDPINLGETNRMTITILNTTDNANNNRDRFLYCKSRNPHAKSQDRIDKYRHIYHFTMQYFCLVS